MIVKNEEAVLERCLKNAGKFADEIIIVDTGSDDKTKKIAQGYTDKIILPEACPSSEPSWFGFLITCKEGVDANKIVEHIEKCGVQTRRLFAGNLTKHPCFDEMRKTGEGYRVVGKLENTDRITTSTFWVGVYPGMTDEMTDYMLKVIKEALSL